MIEKRASQNFIFLGIFTPDFGFITSKNRFSKFFFRINTAKNLFLVAQLENEAPVGDKQIHEQQKSQNVQVMIFSTKNCRD